MTDLHCDTASARLAQVVTGLTELACKRRQFLSLFIIIGKSYLYHIIFIANISFRLMSEAKP